MRICWCTLLFLLSAIACGDEGGTENRSDAAPPVDARILSDAARQACSTEMNLCGEQDYQRVCDSARGFCVECLLSEDCTGSETLGPQCRVADNTCRCGSHEECTANVGGSYCHPIASACGCLSVDDCPANAACEIEPYLGTGIRRCRPL